MKFRVKNIFVVMLMIILMGNTVLLSEVYGDKVNEHSIDKDSVREFVNSIVPEHLAKYNIAGASVAIVRDGKVIFTKGYGYRDSSLGLKADSQTMFRIGSITKLFTWTALMQLVESGQIGLEDDINKYIGDISIVGRYDEPITIKHLMTHTAGIEDKFSNLFTGNVEDLTSLDEALSSDKRSRIFRPGEVIAYSNYGAALAGRIIENVSGMPYEEYIDKNILKPMSMNRSTLQQPASSRYSNVSKGHIYGKDQYRVYEDPFTQLPPIGAMSTSAEDIAKFMIMHLQKGTYKGVTILREDTAELMHRTHYTSDDRLPGICLGFIEWERNNKRIIWHSGGTALFNSLCMLIPEEDLGVFISYNGPNAGDARSEFRQALLDRFYPYESEATTPIKEYKERANKFKGYFKEGRVAVTNSDKLIFALSRYKKVTVNQDGTINFRETKYIEVSPLEFAEVGGQGRLIFEEDRDGNIKYAFQDFEPHEAYIRVSWYENPMIAISILLGCIIIFIALLVIGYIGKLRAKRGLSTHYDVANGVILICILHLLFPLGVVTSIGFEVLNNFSGLISGSIPMLFKVSLIPPLLGGILTVPLISYASGACKVKIWSLHKKVYYLIAIVTSAIYTGWLYYWNILGYFH